MLPQARQNGSPGIANVSPTSAFPRVFPEEKGPRSAHSAQGGFRELAMSFPLDQASVPSERPTAGWGGSAVLPGASASQGWVSPPMGR